MNSLPNLKVISVPTANNGNHDEAENGDVDYDEADEENADVDYDYENADEDENSMSVDEDKLGNNAHA